MAIVFVSPKEKQNQFLKIAAMLMVFFTIIAVLIFLLFKFKNEIQSLPPEGVVGVANLAIDFGLVDSSEIKNLDPFESLMMEFSYAGQDSKGKKVTGSIFAKDKDMAQQNLASQGIIVTSLEEAAIGRKEPFTSYYPINK